MTRIAAQATSYTRESWRDNTRYARRSHIHGKLRSLAIEAEQAGECSWRRGVALLVGLSALAGALWVMVP